MLRQWEVAYPTPAKGPLCAWTVRATVPTGPTHRERREKLRAEEAERRTTTPAAEPGHLRALRVIENKRGRYGVQVVTPRTTTPKNREGKKPTPPIGVKPHQLVPPQLGARRANAAAKPRGGGQMTSVPSHASKQRTSTPAPEEKRRPPPRGRTEAGAPRTAQAECRQRGRTREDEEERRGERRSAPLMPTLLQGLGVLVAESNTNGFGFCSAFSSKLFLL